MIVTVIEKIYGIWTHRDEEVDNMKLRCTLCVREKGSAVATDKLRLKTFRGEDLLVCNRHADWKIFKKESTNETRHEGQDTDSSEN